MSAATKALCYKYRFPGKGQKPVPYSDIAGMVYLTDGTTHPTPMGVWKAVKTFNEPKTKAGRPKGTKKTTNAEHKVIMTTFHKKRPPGYGIEARDVHKALPKKLQQKVSTRTVRRRLADKGYTPQKKVV